MMSLWRHMSLLEFNFYQLLFTISHATNVPNFRSLDKCNLNYVRNIERYIS